MLARSCILTSAAALLAGSATAHMIMQSPVPFSVDKLDNGPLQQGDFPCKQKLGFTVSTMNEIPAGQDQKILFKGSAVHGGGSCQVSISLDKEPTANSKFKVIKSFEGGCPGIDGGPFTDYTFNIPKDVPTGQVTLAWTWFSKLAGQNEMYMNCAPVKITGGAASASSTGFDALPDMFIANIPESNCKTQLSHATKFPNPGKVNDPRGLDSDNLAPSGSSCGASSGGSTGGGSSSAATPPASSSAPPTASSSAGGVFAPGASSAAGGVSSAAASTSTFTTLLTVTATQTPAASSPAPVASSLSPAAPTGTGSTSNGTACSPDGAVVCNGSTKFGLCNHGQVVWQDVAAGTTCANGVISRRMPAKQMIKHKRNPHTHSF